MGFNGGTHNLDCRYYVDLVQDSVSISTLELDRIFLGYLTRHSKF